MTMFTETSNNILHFEADLFISGNLLLLEWCTIKTTQGNTTSTVSELEFNNGCTEGIGNIPKFVQASTSMLILVDERNNCLRSLNRWNAETTPFAGTCDEDAYGFRDGDEPIFRDLRSIIIDEQFDNQLLVGDRFYLRSVTFIGKPIAQTLTVNRKLVENT